MDAMAPGFSLAGFGLGVLLETRQVRKVVASYVGENALF